MLIWPLLGSPAKPLDVFGIDRIIGGRILGNAPHISHQIVHASSGGRFAIAGMQENVRTIFETARLDKVFLSYPHVDAALAAT